MPDVTGNIRIAQVRGSLLLSSTIHRSQPYASQRSSEESAIQSRGCSLEAVRLSSQFHLQAPVSRFKPHRPARGGFARQPIKRQPSP